MRTNLTVIDPDKIEMELLISMSLGDWKRLREQISLDWPSSDLGSAIMDMIRKAEVHFYPEEKIA